MSNRVLGVGELLWDLLPDGKQMGGAPANFAYHAGALGAEATLITRVGNDPLGAELVRRLAALGLATDLIQIDDQTPTGTVTVQLAADGQPQFTIHEGVAWDRLEINSAALAAVAAADAICFGSLAQRREPSRGTIQALMAAARAQALRVFDVNLRQHYYSGALIEQSLSQANVLKLNDSELPILATLLGLDGSPEEQLGQLEQRYELRLVALTRGAHGSLLYAAGHWSHHPGLPVKVKDTVGAGDAFTAAMVLGLLAGMDLEGINQQANEVARHVCSQAGATPPLPKALRRSFAGVTRVQPAMAGARGSGASESRR
jgi:fructokinase